MKAWNWIELFGFITLAASLIFVGIQLKQNHDITLAAQYQERTAMLINALGYRASNMAIKTTEELLEKDYDELSRLERYHNMIFLHISMASLDNCHYQYENGFMEEDTWLSCKERIKFHMRQCRSQKIWNNTIKDVFKPRANFEKLISSLDIKPC